MIFFLCALWIGSEVRWSRFLRPSAEPWSTHRNSSRSVASHAAGSRPQSAGDWDDEAGGGSFQQGMLYYRSEGQVLPIGAGVKPQVVSTLFCEFALILPHHFSTVATTSQLFAALLRPSSSHNSSQLLSSFSISSHLNSSRLFPPLFKSSQGFSPLPTSSHLLPPLLNSSHLLPPLLNSSHLLPPLLNSSDFFSPRVNSAPPPPPTSFQPFLNSPQFFSTFPTLSTSTFFFLNLSSPYFHSFSTVINTSHLVSILVASSHL